MSHLDLIARVRQRTGLLTVAENGRVVTNKRLYRAARHHSWWPARHPHRVGNSD